MTKQQQNSKSHFQKDMIGGYTKKDIKIIATVVVVLVVVLSSLYMIGDSGTSSKNERSKTASSSGDVAVQPTPTPIETHDIIFSRNDKAVIDDIDTKINSVEVKNEIKTSFTEEKTDNQFIIISLTLKNEGDKSDTITPIRYNLIDTEGRTYDAYDSSVFIEADEMLYGSQLNPGLSITKYIAFETAKGVSAAKLQVYNDKQFLKDEKTYILLN